MSRFLSMLLLKVCFVPQNALEVYHKGVSMSVQEAYDAFLGNQVTLPQYQVFSHLRRLGYVVLRHETE